MRVGKEKSFVRDTAERSSPLRHYFPDVADHVIHADTSCLRRGGARRAPWKIRNLHLRQLPHYVWFRIGVTVNLLVHSECEARSCTLITNYIALSDSSQFSPMLQCSAARLGPYDRADSPRPSTPE